MMGFQARQPRRKHAVNHKASKEIKHDREATNI